MTTCPPADRPGSRAVRAVAIVLLAATPVHGGDAAAVATQVQSPALAAFMAEADRWLFAGDMAPADVPIRLSRLAPAERLTAIAYLRRAGLLEGPGFDTGFVLAPAAPTEDAR